MKTIYKTLLSALIVLIFSTTSFSQNCSTVYGAGWNHSGSSDGVQTYSYATNTWNGASLEDLSYFTSPNTINNGGPIAVDPLNQTVNFVTDANNTAAIFTFGTAPTFVKFPSEVSFVTAQLLCSGYKPASHICYYMSINYLSSLPTPSNTGFFSVDFSDVNNPNAKYYTPILSAGSPYVNTSGGGDICFDAHGVGYLVTAAKQLYTVTTDEIANTATFTYIANLSGLPFGPTAIAFDPMAGSALTITGGTSPVYANYNLATNATTTLTNNAGWAAGDLASCFFPNLMPVLNVNKSVYDVTQASPPPVIIGTGDILEYTIVVKNTGNVNAGNLAIADTLPSGVTYIPGSTTINGIAVADKADGSFPFSTPTSANSNEQSYGSGILTTNATVGSPTATLKYKVRVTGASGTQITNSASATATGNDDKLVTTGAGQVSFTVNILVLLPMSLENFDAAAKASSVELGWMINGAAQGNYFIIERSTDGKTFTQIGMVKAIQGDAKDAQHYNFTDGTPVDGKDYYRLSTVGADGKTVYSDIRTVSFGHAISSETNVYPNPVRASNDISLTVPQDYPAFAIRISNMIGQAQIEKTCSSTGGKIRMNIGLSKGVYLLTVTSGSKKLSTTKLVVE